MNAPFLVPDIDHLPRPLAADDLPRITIELEQDLIGCVLTNPHLFAAIQGFVTHEQFHEPAHRDVWQMMEAVAATGDAPSLRFVMAAMGKRAGSRDFNGRPFREYLINLSTKGCLPVSAEGVARSIQAHWQLRELATATVDVREGEPMVPTAALERIYARVDEVRASFVARRAVSATLDDACEDLIQGLQADLQGTGRKLPSSGIGILDAAIGGAPQPSNLIIVAARTSMGKSILGVEIADAIAAQGFASIYHSLEMSKRQVAARIVSSRLQRDNRRLPFGMILERGKLTPRQAETVARVAADMRGTPLTIEDGGRRTMIDIAATSERIANQRARKGIPLGCIVIDHAHIVEPSRVFQREDEGFRQTANAALALAKHLDCPVVLLGQLNRNTEAKERGDKRPQISDIRGSDAFAENADTVCFLYRPAYYIERSQKFRDGDPSAQDAFLQAKHQLEIIIDKNRAGAPNQVLPCWIDTACNAIRDIEGRA